MTGFFMVTIAVFFDIFEIILTATGIGAFIQSATSVFGALIFGFWFVILGVPLLNPRRFAVGAISALVEIFPFTGWLPMWTVGMCIMISMVRLEDRTGVSLRPHTPALK